MGKLWIGIMVIFLTQNTFGQTDSFYAELQIISFEYEGVVVNLDTPKKFVLEKFGCTDTIRLGIINNKEIAFQFEIIKSNLGSQLALVKGFGFFLKQDSLWKMSKMRLYQNCDPIIIADISRMDPKDFTEGSYSGASVTTNTELVITYKDRYYFIKKPY